VKIYRNNLKVACARTSHHAFASLAVKRAVISVATRYQWNRRHQNLKSELLHLMRKRRSIRKYNNDSVSLEKIYHILEAGRLAPSGANLQPWIYIIITDDRLKERIRAKAENVERKYHKTAPDELREWFKEQKISPEKEFLTDAPILVVVAASIKAPYWLQSTWISIAYLLLSIESQDLGSLTYTPTETQFLNRLLRIPDEYRPVVILPIGIPAEKPSPRTRARKTLAQIVHLNSYCLR